MNFFCWHFS